jgi:hypothetical protein
MSSYLYSLPCFFVKMEIQKNLAGMLTHVASTMSLKLSLFALYLRLFNVSRSTRHAVYAGSAAVALFYAGFAAAVLALCTPMLRAERGFSAGVARRCEASDDARIVPLLTFNIVSDVYVFALPVRIVWRLQLHVRRKVAISALFLVGLL